MEEKLRYEEPDMKIAVFTAEDVVTASSGLQIEPIGDGGGGKWGDLF